jgi:hypothetical protein
MECKISSLPIGNKVQIGEIKDFKLEKYEVKYVRVSTRSVEASLHQHCTYLCTAGSYMTDAHI